MCSERFLKFIPFIFSAETAFKKGHYGDWNYVATEHDPNDSGGTTRFGIDKASHPNVDVEHLTKDEAQNIYFDEWSKEGIEGFNNLFGECYFDCCVNAGSSRARKIMAQTGQDAKAFLDAREQFYRRLAEEVSKDARYLVGWLNRIQDLREYLRL